MSDLLTQIASRALGRPAGDERSGSVVRPILAPVFVGPPAIAAPTSSGVRGMTDEEASTPGFDTDAAAEWPDRAGPGDGGPHRRAGWHSTFEGRASVAPGPPGRAADWPTAPERPRRPDETGRDGWPADARRDGGTSAPRARRAAAEPAESVRRVPAMRGSDDRPIAATPAATPDPGAAYLEYGTGDIGVGPIGSPSASISAGRVAREPTRRRIDGSPETPLLGGDTERGPIDARLLRAIRPAPVDSPFVRSPSDERVTDRRGFAHPDEPRDSPVVRVTIGRIEVRAVQGPAPAPAAAARPPGIAPLSLEDYLRHRREGRIR